MGKCADLDPPRRRNSWGIEWMRGEPGRRRRAGGSLTIRNGPAEVASRGAMMAMAIGAHANDHERRTDSVQSAHPLG